MKWMTKYRIWEREHAINFRPTNSKNINVFIQFVRNWLFYYKKLGGIEFIENS